MSNQVLDGFLGKKRTWRALLMTLILLKMSWKDKAVRARVSSLMTSKEIQEPLVEAP